MLIYEKKYKNNEIKKTADYPYGKALPFDANLREGGFPYKDENINDLDLGWMQALLVEAGVDPSDREEKVGDSDVMRALKKLALDPIKDLQGKVKTLQDQAKKAKKKLEALFPAGSLVALPDQGLDPKNILGGEEWNSTDVLEKNGVKLTVWKREK